MKLLIDIGNTRVKWCEFQEQQLLPVHALVHNKSNIKAELLAAWKGLRIPDILVLACVSSMIVKQQLIEVATLLWADIDIIETKAQQYAYGISNSYVQPEKLGVDRWLAMIAAFKEYSSSSLCVVDCGTAVTFDALDKKGVHLGGMIMPGLSLMQKALYKGTENLAIGTELHTLGLANNTEAAVYNGNLSAVKGFIESGLSGINAAKTVILTGGDACFIAESLNFQTIVDTRLVFKGLAIIANDISMT